MSKDSSNKKQKPNPEVSTILEDAQDNIAVPSPFSSGLFGTVPLSQPTSKSPDLQKAYSDRLKEIQALEMKLQLLQQQPPPPAVVMPAPTMAAPTSEFLSFFKEMETARIKSVAEASAIQVAARKEDLKSMETLSKKLTKKQGDKHNLKQTAILLGTDEALSLLSEG